MKTAQLLNMPAPLWVYVDDLRATGLYGNSISGVIRTLVAAGIQDAIGKRLIRLRQFDMEDDAHPASSPEEAK